LAAGDRTGALESYRKSLAISEKLAQDDPGNVQGQTDLIVSYYKLSQAGDAPRENLTKALSIVKRLESEGKLSAQQTGWVGALEAAIAALDAPPEPSPMQQVLAAIDAAFQGGDYARAAQLRQALAVAIEKGETEADGKPGAATASALGNYAYYALFARDLEAALAASERALALKPDELWLATNRAHALMFLGRMDQAKAAYLEHRGKTVGQKPWEAVILEDFAEFEKRGMTHPQMGEMRAALAAAN
jgi:tetratricopeptide (TPR) repeat protein